jgi:NitT/TauT family transport system substrate-binding protein
MSSISRLALRRRTLLGVAASAPLAMPAIVRGQKLRPVKFISSWVPEGAYAYLYVAKARGFWASRGLDVDIARGSGSLSSSAAVAQGTYEFGLSTAAAVILQSAKGLGLTSIVACDYDPTMCIAMLESSPIRRPADLEGKIVAQTLSSSDSPFFAPFCTLNKVDISKVQLLNMDAYVRNQALPQGRVDAITGLASSTLSSLGSKGVALRFMMYRDFGLPLYVNNVVITRPETLQKDPDLCQAFAEGLTEGLALTIAHPEEAQQAFMDGVPEVKLSKDGPEFTRLGMGVQRYSFLGTDDAKDHGVGYYDPEKMQAMIALVLKYQVESGAKVPAMEEMFTNRFIGKVKLSSADWANAQSQTGWVNKMLRG